MPVLTDRPVDSPWTQSDVYVALARYAERFEERTSIRQVEEQFDATRALLHLPTEFQLRFALWHWLLQQPTSELERRLGWADGSGEVMRARIIGKIRKFLMRGVRRSAPK